MRRQLLAAAVLACALAVCQAGPASGAYRTDNPHANIPLGPLPAACGSDPLGAVCEDGTIRALDAARASLGLPRYLLPADFVTLKPTRQWLILSNLDRLSYGLRPVIGLTLKLDAIARQGALSDNDPNPFPYLRSLHSVAALGFASNWAGGQANALLAYYGWMYDDGYGGPNLDCTTPTSSGCWGHRDDVLAFPQGGTIAMGGAVVRAKRSYALTLVDTSAPVFQYAYTWADARADGADRG